MQVYSLQKQEDKILSLQPWFASAHFGCHDTQAPGKPCHLDRFLLFHLVRAGAWRLSGRGCSRREVREGTSRSFIKRQGVASSAGWAGGRQGQESGPVHTHPQPSTSQQLPENRLQAPVSPPWLPAPGLRDEAWVSSCIRPPLPGVCP